MPRYSRQRFFPVSAAEAWDILADTDHLNRMIGLPVVEFGEPRNLVRRARARFYGIPARWDEHPFQWVRERGYTVRRDFAFGPVRTMTVGMELEPAEGGTLVRIVADLTPRGALWRPFMRAVAAPGLGRTLAYVERSLAERRDALAPPAPARPGPVDRAALARAVALLGEAPVDPALVQRLEALVLRGSDDQLVRVRPYALADRWGADRGQVLRLFFHATRAGLFDLRWELLCPACRVPKAEAAGLGSLPPTYHCDTCRIEYDADFEERVELRFSVRPAVRAAEDVIYCVGSPMRSPHVVAQVPLAPGESRTVVPPAEGALRLRAIGEPSEAAPEPGDAFAWEAGGWRPVRDGAAGGSGLAVGAAVTLENRSDRPVLAVLERPDDDGRAATAARVTLMQEFRDLFGSEVLAPGHEVGISTIAVVFTDLLGSTAMYEGAGDAPAYGRVRRHFEFLRERVAGGGGAVIKTIGDAVMAAFPTADAALAAALAMQAELAGWCRAAGIDPPLVLKIGLHAGPAVAVTANERLDYFGRTINLAARIQKQAGAGEVALTEELWEALGRPGGAAERFEATLPGIEGSVPLLRLKPA
ncbi:MAG TPA: DUF5939 domain-containing protein [Gemmatimonadota bacterium]|nr:DUF5939 domain-containing protein [Gemmatimonadota bacterium]